MVSVCFCCVRFSFSFSIPNHEIGLGNVSEMARETLTQSSSEKSMFVMNTQLDAFAVTKVAVSKH